MTVPVGVFPPMSREEVKRKVAAYLEDADAAKVTVGQILAKVWKHFKISAAEGGKLAKEHSELIVVACQKKFGKKRKRDGGGEKKEKRPRNMNASDWFVPADDDAMQSFGIKALGDNQIACSLHAFYQEGGSKGPASKGPLHLQLHPSKAVKFAPPI